MRRYLLFFILSVISIPWTNAHLKKNKQIIIFIDPGHGGSDPGKLAVQAGMKDEKYLNLAIAIKLGNYIDQRIDDTKVIYSRTDDSSKSLDDVVEMANTSNADYFISIHCNSNPNEQIYGTRIHIQDYDFKVSHNLANLIEHEFSTRAGRKSRGIMDAQERGENYQVLQYSKMPGVLVECGFMSNLKEEIFLNSELGQDYIASAIFRAFRTHLLGADLYEETRDNIYKIQILASTTPIDFKEKRFLNLDMRIEEYVFKERKYAYNYMVGREYDIDTAKKLQKKIRKKGFKDAFIVPMIDGQLKINRVSR